MSKETLQEILANTYMMKLDEGMKAAYYFILKELQKFVEKEGSK
jgi:hypothetical protein